MPSNIAEEESKSVWVITYLCCDIQKSSLKLNKELTCELPVTETKGLCYAKDGVRLLKHT